MQSDIQTGYQLVVGLEVHIQLATESKLFASDATTYGQSPNTNVSVITLAHPGIMPKLNKKAVEFAIRMGLACESKISRHCIFDRKNYFYPDLPKGFQTTQDKTPICIGGEIPVLLRNQSESVIKLNRIHLEEDAGKSIHEENADESFIDLNRAGVPLIELVTEPMIGSAEEAMALLTEIRRMVRYLEICDGNMEQGSLRCDANISVKENRENVLGKKVEVKNMNSIRNVGRAIEYEMTRQIALLERGDEVISETRLFDAGSGKTAGMRTKEELNDYRYFPEPDLSPFEVSDEWLTKIRDEMPDTPRMMRERFIEEYDLSAYDAGVLTDDKTIALFFQRVCEQTKHYKQAANWISGPVKSILNQEKEEEVSMPLTEKQLSDLVNAVADGLVNTSVASKMVFPSLINQSLSVKEVMEKLDLASTSEDDISDVILNVLAAYPEKVEAYQKGKKNLLGLFMGEVMKKTNGIADPKIVNELLQDALEQNK